MSIIPINQQLAWLEELDAVTMAKNPPWFQFLIPQIANTIIHYKQSQEWLNANVHVYYLEDEIKLNDSTIERFLTCVPQVCVNSDRYIMLQNGQEVESYTMAKKLQPLLLTYDERIQSRRKIVLSSSRVYAYGGYNSKVTLLKEPQALLILSACGAQLDVPKLDYKLFIDPKKSELKWNIFLESMRKDVALWLISLENYLINYNETSNSDRKAQFRVPPIGAGFFAQTSIGNFGIQVQAAILTAFADVLESIVDQLNQIEHIEFTYFNVENPLIVQTNVIERLHQVFRCSFTNNDICLPLSKHQANRILVVLNPSDTFSIAGNEFSYASVEAEIGNNTTLRIDQSYQHNWQILDHRRYHTILL